MFTKLTIDGKEIELAANAATPFRYKQIFKKDLFSVFGNEQKAQEEGVEAVSRLAFVMTKQAEKADMSKVTETEFYDWLEGFGAMAFVESADDIMSAYMGTETNTSATP